MALAVALGVVPLLLSCGGGGGGGSAPVVKAPGIYGTAASGLGHSGGKIDVVDGDGNSDGGQADGSGDFTIPTTIVKTPPYLLRVITTTLPTTTLYSVSADEKAATTINITPLTDLIIRSWYSAQTPSITIEDAFADPVTHPAPKPDSVSLIHNLIKNIVQLWLDKNGVTSSDFNLISTPFTAGTITVPGTGLDKVLDQAWVNASTGQIVISNGTTTQNTTLNAFLSSLTASTTTVSQVTGSTVESGNNDITSVPTTTVTQAALTGINTTLANIANTITSRGFFLSAADLQPYMDPALMHDGLNQGLFADVTRLMALQMKATGQNLLFTVKAVKSFDTVNNVADVRLSENGPDTFKLRQIQFKKDAGTGTWLVYGNRRVANIDLRPIMTNQQGNTCPACSGPSVNVKVEAQPGVVSSVSVTGGGIWNSPTAVSYLDQVNYGVIIRDRFWKSSGVIPALPPKDSEFTIAVTKAAGGTDRYTELSSAYTLEPISITKINGTTPGNKIADAHLGSAISVEWTEPKTFAIKSRSLNYQVFTTGPTCMGESSSIGITNGTINMPNNCSGNYSVTQVNLSAMISGVNGETTSALWVFIP
jgi:hypothetical protein